MQRGALPKPTAIKILEGNPGKRPLNQREPKPATFERVPEPPAYLAGDARAEWEARAPELFRLGCLTEIDVAQFAAYCHAFGVWRQAISALRKMAEQDMLTGALMIRTANGNPVQNPLVGTANRAVEQMVRLSGEFGMTPASRSRIAATPHESDDPLAKLLGI